MAGRIRNRLDLRREAEAAALRGAEPTADATRVSGARSSRAQKGSGRVCARWGVFDGSMKLVASFDYSRRAEADQKVAELNDERPGTYFVQMVKETVSDDLD